MLFEALPCWFVPTAVGLPAFKPLLLFVERLWGF
jgi:hypothetical protein